MRKTIVCDYDGVLELKDGKPNKKLINFLNKSKCRIIIWSSRDWVYYDYIEYNLKKWKLKYDLIVCGKPLADIYIDDRVVKWEHLI